MYGVNFKKAYQLHMLDSESGLMKLDYEDDDFDEICRCLPNDGTVAAVSCYDHGQLNIMESVGENDFTNFKFEGWDF